MQGYTPRVVDDARSKYGARVEPDPNPMLPSPTLADRTRAANEIANRAWGLPVQSIQIDAQLKASYDAGIAPEYLKGQDLNLLMDIKNAFQKRLGTGKDEVEDAEIVSETQEPCQVETPADQSNPGIERSVPNPLQTLVDLANSNPYLDEAKGNINENSPPEDDSSEL